MFVSYKLTKKRRNIHRHHAGLEVQTQASPLHIKQTNKQKTNKQAPEDSWKREGSSALLMSSLAGSCYAGKGVCGGGREDGFSSAPYALLITGPAIVPSPAERSSR